MTIRGPSVAVSLLSVALLGTVPREVRAYSCESLVRIGCHERITSEALRRVRAQSEDAAAPEGATRNERALIDDVQFDADSDMMDIAAITLLLGVRDNDLKGLSVNDLTALTEVHGNPDHQKEHCLRGSADGEPGGTEAALGACRAFISRRVREAMDGLDEEGQPDLDSTTELAVHLARRGDVDAPLSTYYVRMGQALHALQDSFTHTYRTPDGLQVTVIVDWIHLTNGDDDEASHGPPHSSELDECTDLDDLRQLRRDLAIEASVELIEATLGRDRSRSQKEADVATVLDRYMGFSSGCDFDNDWCDAPERSYAVQSMGCSVFSGGRTSGGGVAVMAGLALVGLALLRRTRRRAALGLMSALAVAGTLALGAGTASADELTDAELESGVEPPPTEPVPEPGPSNPSHTTVGLYVGGFGSVSQGAFGAQAGLRVRYSKHWTFGLDGEWNPWLAYNGPNFVRKGAVNVYGTLILRFPLAYQSFNLATTANVGVSYLLDDLYGAPSGSMGPYFGFSPLGLEWKASSAFLIIINPLNFAIPIPKVTGVPLWFPQYRFTIGIAVMAG